MLVGRPGAVALAGHRRLRLLRARHRQHGADRFFGRRQPAGHVVRHRHERRHHDGLFRHPGGALGDRLRRPSDRLLAGFRRLSGLLVVVCLMAGSLRRAEFAPDSAGRIALQLRHRGNPRRGGCARWCARRDAWRATSAASAAARSGSSVSTSGSRSASGFWREADAVAGLASPPTARSGCRCGSGRHAGRRRRRIAAKPRMISSPRSKPMRSWPSKILPGSLRSAPPVEIGLRRAGDERQVGDLARDQLVLAGFTMRIAMSASRRSRFSTWFDATISTSMPGSSSAEPRQHRRQHIGRDHLAGGDAHRAGDRLGRRPAPAARRRVACSLDRRGRVRYSAAPASGQLVAAPPAPEQRRRRAPAPSSAIWRPSVGWLAASLRAGSRQAAGFGDGDEALDEVPVEIGHPIQN